MSIMCERCRSGGHAHDRYTVEGAQAFAHLGAEPGGDAGCPNGIPPHMDPCDCNVTLDPLAGPVPMRPFTWPAEAINERDRLTEALAALSWEMCPTDGRALRDALGMRA